MATKRMIIMLVFTALVFGTVFGIKEFGRRAMVSNLANMPTPPETVTASEVQIVRWQSQASAVGSLIAVNGSNISNEVDGTVTAIHFQSGDWVKRGDLLVELDSDVEATELKQRKAEAELADITRKRRERLFGLKSISRAELDEAVSQSNVARAAVSTQEALLEQKRIRAPFDGKIGIRRISIGQYLASGTAIAALESVDPIEVEFSLPESELARIVAGLPIEVRVDSYPEHVFPGKINALESRVSRDTRNFDVRATLSNSDGLLRSGQFARVRMTFPGEHDVVVVPQTAIQYNSYGNSVFLVVKDPEKGPPPEKTDPRAPPYTDLKVEQRFIKLGNTRGDFVAITEGLNAGERVITSGLLKLANGKPVIIDNAAELDAEFSPVVPQG